MANGQESELDFNIILVVVKRWIGYELPGQRLH